MASVTGQCTAGKEGGMTLTHTVRDPDQRYRPQTTEGVGLDRNRVSAVRRSQSVNREPDP